MKKADLIVLLLMLGCLMIGGSTIWLFVNILLDLSEAGELNVLGAVFSKAYLSVVVSGILLCLSSLVIIKSEEKKLGSDEEIIEAAKKFKGRGD